MRVSGAGGSMRSKCTKSSVLFSGSGPGGILPDLDHRAGGDQLRAVSPPEPPPRVYLPMKTTVKDAAKLRSEGWITVAGLENRGDAEAEAARLGCTHVADGAKPREFKKPNKE